MRPFAVRIRVLRVLAVSLGVGALLLYGGSTRATSLQAPPAGALALKPAVSINATMVALIDHAAHGLWDVEREGNAPKNDAAWEEVQEDATQLALAGTLIQLGGTGVSDAGWAAKANWKKHSQELTTAALLAVAAARSRNMSALVEANGDLTQVCENCHNEFKPALPTEGVVHTHRHREN
jgi:Cytochrome C'